MNYCWATAQEKHLLFEDTFCEIFRKCPFFFAGCSICFDKILYGGAERMISEQTKEYFELGKRNDVRESAKRLRRQYLRYKDAEIVYSIQHKKLLEMASKAGAIYRIDGTVLINRDIFDQYLEQFHEPSTIALEESL
jgi:microsomal dipeptidase-like Zn-dependent dipeptidase